MKDLITLSRSSADFASYLRGTFSESARALPVQSLNLNTDNETVTFRIIPLSALERPSWIQSWWTALRIPTWFAPLGILLWVFCSANPALSDPDMGWLVVLGVIALTASLRLRNDKQDYLTGYDRIRAERGNPALKKGWLTVTEFERVSSLFFVMACGCAVALAVFRPSTMATLSLAAALGVWAFFRKSGEPLSDRPFSQLILFLLGGPLLAVGAEQALTGSFRLETILYGSLWAWAAFFPKHMRDLENLVVEGQAGRATIVGHLGFDKSQKAIDLWWLATVAAFAGLHYMFVNRVLSLAMIFVLLLASAPFLTSLRKLKSPAGSAVGRLRIRAEYLYLAFCALWILDCFWWLRW